MIFLQARPIKTIDDAFELLQMAVELEFSTLPPYLYALYSIKPGSNAEAANRIRFVAMEEMAHMCLACNILNALGRNPVLTAPSYPGPLPGGISAGGQEALIIHLYPFSKESMNQAMLIEEPEGGAIDFPHEMLEAAPTFMTIGQFYNHLDKFLATLPASRWTAPDRCAPVPAGGDFRGQQLRRCPSRDYANRVGRRGLEGKPADFRGRGLALLSLR
jgi:hypothetical protein